mgnify:CR=1 FL=1
MNTVGESLRFMAVGDLFMGEHPPTAGHGVDTMVARYGPDFPFEHVVHVLNRAEVVTGNLEGIISGLGRIRKDFMSNCFRGRPEVAGALARSGFRALSLANNHSMQHGIEALRDTVSILDTVGIGSTGINEEDPRRAEPVLIRVNGVKVAVLGYCSISQQYYLDNRIVCIGEYENIVGDVKLIREEVDFVVLHLHWGDEFVDRPSPEQIDLGRRLIDAGVDLIIGHHSHVLQGIERYGDGLIVYSLGSFVKDLWKRNMRESVIFECTLSREHGISNLRYTPICINSFHQPEVLSGEPADLIRKRLTDLSHQLENEDLSDFERKLEDYQRKVAKRLAKDRRDTYLYYLRNVGRYDPVMLMKNLATVVRRRVTKRPI